MTSNTKKSQPSDTDTVTLQPAMQQLGVTKCPVCKRQVAVFLTRTKRPFINCSFCSARIFYNGEESMRRLEKRMAPADRS